MHIQGNEFFEKEIIDYIDYSISKVGQIAERQEGSKEDGTSINVTLDGK